MRNSPKIAIKASLDEMDRFQAEKVLQYIKNLLSQPPKEHSYVAFKRAAMREIRQALNRA